MSGEFTPAFPRRRSVDGQRVHAAGEFPGQRLVDHAVALKPGLPFEGVRHNIDPVMGLAARPVPGMAFVRWDSSSTLRLCGAKASVNFCVIRSAVRMLLGFK